MNITSSSCVHFTRWIHIRMNDAVNPPPPLTFFANSWNATRSGVWMLITVEIVSLHWHGALCMRKSKDTRSLERQTTVCNATLVHRLALTLDRTSLSMTSRSKNTIYSEFKRSTLTLSEESVITKDRIYTWNLCFLTSFLPSFCSSYQSRFSVFKRFRMFSIL
jgi:hypothetical protein